MPCRVQSAILKAMCRRLIHNATSNFQVAGSCVYKESVTGCKWGAFYGVGGGKEGAEQRSSGGSEDWRRRIRGVLPPGSERLSIRSIAQGAALEALLGCDCRVYG